MGHLNILPDSCTAALSLWTLGSDICPANFAYSSLIPKARPMLDLQGLGLRVSSAAPWPDSAYAPNSGKSS